MPPMNSPGLDFRESLPLGLASYDNLDPEFESLLACSDSLLDLGSLALDLEAHPESTSSLHSPSMTPPSSLSFTPISSSLPSTRSHPSTPPATFPSPPIHCRDRQAQHSSYQCPQCPKTFETHDKFKSHIRRSHNKRLACRFPGCDELFCTNGDRQRHEGSLAHGGVGRFGCQECGQRFPQHYNLLRHARSIHGSDLGVRKERRRRKATQRVGKAPRVDSGVVREPAQLGGSGVDDEGVLGGGTCCVDDTVGSTDDMWEGLEDLGVGALDSGLDWAV
ncbi:hypothetical protein B0J18DRAFT_62879 [Chaetomium sp. MPI-SDFR-AT-0129]|nr:hypothetical protein B0J18DRAFT_62879 [Chaetomium sp. MPI-SDFR-AT-0129]